MNRSKSSLNFSELSFLDRIFLSFFDVATDCYQKGWGILAGYRNYTTFVLANKKMVPWPSG